MQVAARFAGGEEDFHAARGYPGVVRGDAVQADSRWSVSTASAIAASRREPTRGRARGRATARCGMPAVAAHQFAWPGAARSADRASGWPGVPASRGRMPHPRGGRPCDQRQAGTTRNPRRATSPGKTRNAPRAKASPLTASRRAAQEKSFARRNCADGGQQARQVAPAARQAVRRAIARDLGEDQVVLREPRDQLRDEVRRHAQPGHPVAITRSPREAAMPADSAALVPRGLIESQHAQRRKLAQQLAPAPAVAAADDASSMQMIS